MSFGNLITTTAASISSGGTINGSLTIDGDLTVNGDGSGNYDEIVNGNLAISSTNKLVLGGDGSDTYLQESSADVLDIYVGGANMIKLTESTTDTVTVTGALTVGSDGSGHDVIFYSDTAGDNFTWDSSAEKLTITGTNGATALDVADGNLVVADNVDIEGDIDVNGTANLDAVDIDGAVDMASTLAVGGTSLLTGRVGVITAGDLGVGVHIRSADSGADVSVHGDELVIEGSGASGLTILSGTSSQGDIYFGDSGDNDIGQIYYDHSANTMAFITNAAAGQMYLDSSGQLKITKDTDAEFVSLVLVNQSDAASTAGIVSQRFDLEDTGGNAVDSGKILVGKEASFTATASTQDSYMALHTSLNGTLAEKMRITSAGSVGI